MPNDTFSDAIKEAFALAPAGVYILNTLEIRQDGVQSPIFLVQARLPLIATDENGATHEFSPASFQFTLPPSTEEGVQSLNIAVDNIDRKVSDFAAIAKSERVPIKVIFRPYLSNDLSAPQMNPPLTLYLKSIELNSFQGQGQASFLDIVNKKFPSELYTRGQFPALG